MSRPIIRLSDLRDEFHLLAVPVMAANPQIEFDAWVDHTTDNILLKAYHVDEHFALGCAVTRKTIQEHPDLTAEVSGAWVALAEAMNHRPVPADWYIEQKPRRIADLATLKGCARVAAEAGEPVSVDPIFSAIAALHSARRT